jgi:hypothetical protein
MYVLSTETSPGCGLVRVEPVPVIAVPLTRHTGSDSVSQFVPEYPAGQLHVYVLTPSTHVPPFWQVTDTQSSMLVSQFVPVKPGTHEHEYVLTPSTQLPPFWQGAPAQSSMLFSQFVPL